MIATTSIDHLNIFVPRFLRKQFNVSADFSPEEGVTFLIKGNRKSVEAIMEAMFLPFAHAIRVLTTVL